MRILIGSESFHPNISGVAIAARNLAAHLVTKGHQVLVLAPSTGYSAYSEKYQEGFVVQRLESVPNPFRRGFRVTLFPFQEIRSIVDSWQPDIIHLEDPTSIGTCLLRSAQLNHVPVVVSHHFSTEYILSYIRFLSPLHGLIRKRLLRSMADFYNRCQYVICPSETVKNSLLAMGVEVPVTAISNGVNLSRFFSYELPSGIRTDLGLPEIPIVLYVGRIDQDKNLDVLFSAIPLIIGRQPAHFVFCGGGNLVGRLRKKARHDQLEDHVTFLGQLDYDTRELPRLYQIASCFVMPSRIETQSIVTMEAMASGLPIVAAWAGALPELVSAGENGLLFTPDDPVDLADKICLLLGDPQLAKQMGHCGIIKIVEHELHRSLDKIELIYEEALSYKTQ